MTVNQISCGLGLDIGDEVLALPPRRQAPGPQQPRSRPPVWPARTRWRPFAASRPLVRSSSSVAAAPPRWQAAGPRFPASRSTIRCRSSSSVRFAVRRAARPRPPFWSARTQALMAWPRRKSESPARGEISALKVAKRQRGICQYSRNARMPFSYPFCVQSYSAPHVSMSSWDGA